MSSTGRSSKALLLSLTVLCLLMLPGCDMPITCYLFGIGELFGEDCGGEDEGSSQLVSQLQSIPKKTGGGYDIKKCGSYQPCSQDDYSNQEDMPDKPVSINLRCQCPDGKYCGYTEDKGGYYCQDYLNEECDYLQQGTNASGCDYDNSESDDDYSTEIYDDPDADYDNGEY